MEDFVHLHVHTYYSILDGQSSIKKLVDKAIADGMKGMAITESVALCEALDAYLPDRRVEIKWPNDIYYGDGKLCGILIENRLQGGVIRDSIIGIGLNVNQEVFLSDAPNPVSLRQILGRDTDREGLCAGR